MVETRWEELLERSVGVLEKSAVGFVENWKESCTKELEKCLVEKCCCTEVVCRPPRSMMHGFILDVQDSVRSGSEGCWTSESMVFFVYSISGMQGRQKKNMFLLSWIGGTASFVNLVYSQYSHMFQKKSRNSASWFLSGIFVIRFCSPTQLSRPEVKAEVSKGRWNRWAPSVLWLRVWVHIGSENHHYNQKDVQSQMDISDICILNEFLTVSSGIAIGFVFTRKKLNSISDLECTFWLAAEQGVGSWKI